MFPKARLFFATLGGAAALALVPQAAEAGTVVAVSGPSAEQYPVGTQIGDTQRITLRQGDTVTVLDGGRTRVFRGPGTFILARRGGRTDNSALAALTTRRPGGQARVAAGRGEPGDRANPNLWYVDVTRSGRICLANPDPLQLWRADDTQQAIYSVNRAGSTDEAVSVTFPQGESLGIWQGALQVREGATYTLATAPDDEAVQVEFVFLQEVPQDGDALALALIENGCTLQLEQMAEALAE